jgi:hypothetical protein
LLTPSPTGTPANLTPTLGRQDHTPSPYAAVPFVIGTSASTASRPAFRDDREPPLLVGRDARMIQVIWVGVKNNSDNRNTGFFPSALIPKAAFKRMRGWVGLGFHNGSGASPSAPAQSVRVKNAQRRSRVHRIPNPTLVTTADAPLWGTGQGDKCRWFGYGSQAGKEGRDSGAN